MGIDPFFKKIGGVFPIFYALLVVLFLLMLLTIATKKEIESPCVNFQKKKRESRALDSPILFQGALSLKQKGLKLGLFDLSKELKGGLIPACPGRQGREGLFLTLNGSNAKVASGERVFVAPSPKKYRFVKDKTPLSLLFTIEEGGRVLVEQKIDLERVEGVEEQLYEPLTYPLKLSSSSYHPLAESIQRSLTSLSYLGDDLVRGGGAKRFRIGDHLISLSSEECLSFSEKEWKKASPSQEVENATIAKWKLDRAGKLQMEIWGEEEGSYFAMLLPKAPCKAMQAPTDLIKEARKRSKSQVSCLFKGKRVVLKRGDWVVKKETGWRILKTEGQREAFIAKEEETPLFIFDSLVTKGGKETIVGRWIHPLRIESQEIAIPLIDSGRKSTEGKAKGRGV